MARPRVVKVTFPGLIAWEGWFAKLLATANRNLRLARGDDLGSDIPRLAQFFADEPAGEIRDAIQALHDGRRPSIAPTSALRAWTWITIHNFRAHLYAGALHLRRCPQCDDWFFTESAKRRTCHRGRCQKALVAKRRAKARRKVYEEQRRARVTVRGTWRTK